MSYFFTADTHFNHENIIRYCHRPFSSVEEMNETIIERWNKIVAPQDCVYHLGDFGFDPYERDGKFGPELIKIVRRLHGSKVLIAGNHDRNLHKEFKAGFHSVRDLDYRILGGRAIAMCHYPMLSWRSREKGSFM